VVLCVFIASGAAGEERVFAPFVSRLTVEVKNNLVRLIWRDSPDVRGPVYVYRSRLPFEGGVSQERPEELPYGSESYVDEPESAGTFYYFVAASDGGGKIYNIPIPLTNTVSVSIQEVSSGVISGGPLPADDTALVETVVQGNSVVIRFTLRGGGTPVLYRSVQPIRNVQDLLSAVIVQTAVQSPFTDYPVRDIDYYYAVIFEEDLAQGRVAIVPGQNATTQAARLSSGTGERGDLRSMPLPLVSVGNAVPRSQGLSETPSPGNLSPEAERAVSVLLGRSESRAVPERKSPRAFLRDMDENSGGADYTLGAIVRDSFRAGQWERARNELIQFLSLPRNADLEYRAHFYLGQACYFLDKYQEALFEFLLVRPYEDAEASVWIDAVLAALSAYAPQE
ncbi:MAG: CDC27 family protein, partial [Spirochaetaceae bacterium]|nr:CDC27 family protein [Spirochaetaceae bacterium]